MDVTSLLSFLADHATGPELVTYGFYSILCHLIKQHLNTLRKLQRDVAKIHTTLGEHSQWQTFVEHRLDKLEQPD